MVNPLTVNPTTAARRLTVGASDWLWVVTAIMGISAVLTLAWAKAVRWSLFWSCQADVGLLSKATTRSTGIPSLGSSRAHSVHYSLLCYGIEPGANACQNRV